MKILVISDTHGNIKGLHTIKQRIPDGIERIIHLGDCEGQDERIRSLMGVPMDIVRGNCDFFTPNPDNLVLEFGRHKCLLTHGHLFDVRRGHDILVRAAKEVGADYAFYGHTHRMVATYEDGVTVVNPGSLSRPRDEGCSFIIMEVDDKGEIHLSLNRL